MNARARSPEVHDLDEGSWAYLSLWDQDERTGRHLHERVIEACESSGWPAVSWSPPAHEGNMIDSSRFFEGMSHAVEHADVVIVLMNRCSAMTDAELAFAYRHNRPVVGLRLRGGEEVAVSEVQAMLQRYTRARVIECENVDGCVSGLREALADSEFTATIREASGEQWDGA
jgi:nucleoside 2-deoxyribosyltransferase